ncbi:TVP38/TMEM64 family protein [Candidatus Woesearchaeota archaeon]|nr:TVP38/TMEM64 family protein [Candidatus Woesearchaeota archaeon]
MKTSKRVIIFLILIFLIISIRFSGLSNYLTFENLKTNKEFLKQSVNQSYLFYVIAFIILYIIVTGFSIPGATILTLASGFLFGTIFGAFYAVIGATIGATLAFLLSRYLIGNWVQKKYESNLKKFNKEISENGFSYLLTLRLIPIFPFFLINILSGLTKIPLKTFIWTTAIGIIPGSLVYSFSGKQLDFINSVSDVFSTRILIAFLLLALLALIPVIFRYAKNKDKIKNIF